MDVRNKKKNMIKNDSQHCLYLYSVEICCHHVINTASQKYR